MHMFFIQPFLNEGIFFKKATLYAQSFLQSLKMVVKMMIRWTFFFEKLETYCEKTCFWKKLELPFILVYFLKGKQNK